LSLVTLNAKLFYLVLAYLMMETISKSELKAHALKVFRDIEKSGRSIIVTDRGTPTFEIRKLRRQKQSPRQLLKGTVIKFDKATEPVSVDDWENA